MPEEPSEVEETPDAPDESGPEEAPAGTEESQPATDWEKRYNDLRPQYDRTQSRVTEFETFYQNLTNPETQAQALQALGLQLDGGEDDEDDYVDPDDRVDRIEQYLASQHEEQQAQVVQQLQAEFYELEMAKLPDDLSQNEKDIVLNLAGEFEDADGLPDIQGAYKYLQEAWEVARQRYTKSKKAPGVSPGTAGDEKIDLDDDDARVNFMAAAMEAEAQD